MQIKVLHLEEVLKEAKNRFHNELLEYEKAVKAMKQMKNDKSSNGKEVKNHNYNQGSSSSKNK